MPRKSDRSPEAERLALAQAVRLRRLRRILTAYQADAAEVAQISQDAWSRMELGVARIDSVALGRFAAHCGVTADYVITGRLTGLPEPVLRRVMASEAADPLAQAPEPPALPEEPLEVPPPSPPAGGAGASAGRRARKGRRRASTLPGEDKEGTPATRLEVLL